MSDRPWYKRYGADFVLSTMGLSLEEKGAFSICIDMIYDRRGPIPDDARWLAGLCSISARRWGIIRSSLIEKRKLFVTDDGRLMNYRAEKTLENVTKTQDKSDEKSSKTKDKFEINGVDLNKNKVVTAPRARARAHTRTRLPEARSQIESTLPNGSGPTPADDEPLGDPPKAKEKAQADAKPPAPSAKGSRLPVGWTPSEENIAKALAMAADLEVSCDEKWLRWIAQRFHDYWVAQPGQRGVRVDWDAVWRTWCDRDFREGDGRGRNSRQRSRPGGGIDERDDRIGSMLKGAGQALDRRR